MSDYEGLDGTSTQSNSKESTLFTDRNRLEQLGTELDDLLANNSTHGAPQSAASMQLSINRFDKWRYNRYKLGSSVPYDGKTVIEFCHALVYELNESKLSNQNAPSLSLIQQTKMHLIQHGHMLSSGFKFSDQNKEQWKIWESNQINSGRIQPGTSTQEVHLTALTCSMMVTRWYEVHLLSGTSSWDKVIVKAMSIILLVALASRSGDICLSALYDEEYRLCWSDVVIHVNPSMRLEDLHAIFTLRFTKGLKKVPSLWAQTYYMYEKTMLTVPCSKVMNKDVIIEVPALRDPLYNHMCSIQILLVHALRHGLVRCGSDNSHSVENAIRYGFNHPRHVIQWTHPDWPVLPQFHPQNHSQCVLSQPANTTQIWQNIRRVGLASGVLSEPTPRSIRYGAARDIAHLDQSQTPGINTEAARKALGHSMASKNSGTTDLYIGNIGSFIKERIEAERFDMRAPCFTMGLTTTLPKCDLRISEEEIKQYMEENAKPFAKSNLIDERRTAVYHLKNIRIAHFNATAESLPHDKESFMTNMKKSIQTINRLLCDPNASNESMNSNTSLCIDAGSKIHVASTFTTHLAKINIVNSQTFVRQWIQEGKTFQTPPSIAMMSFANFGNSRDCPTPFLFRCTTPGCTTTSTELVNISAHQRLCTVEKVARRIQLQQPRPFQCDADGCNSGFYTQDDLKNHKKKLHSWKHRQCEVPGCSDAGRLFTSRTTYIRHVRDAHEGLYPHTCTVENCGDVIENSKKFERHLTDKHGLRVAKERAKYFPQKVKQPVPKSKQSSQTSLMDHFVVTKKQKLEDN